MRLGRLGRLAALALALALVATLTGPASAGDPRWVFYTKDQTHYTSPWFKGAHRIMVPFGCTRAPYYSSDPRCRDDRGFHHGLDIAMRCGTPLYAAVRMRAIRTDSLGPAYGDNPVLLRSRKLGFDLRRLTPLQSASVVARLRYPEPEVMSFKRAHRIAVRAQQILQLQGRLSEQGLGPLLLQSRQAT